MSKILKNRVFGRLSMILAIMMIMPIIAPAYGAEKPVNQVVISNVQGDSKISAGKGDGMNVGDKGVIVRDGKEVANFEVTNVEWGYSSIKLSGLASGETLRVGDAAQVTTHAKPGEGQSIKKSNSGAKALLALLVVGAVVALSSGGGHGGGGGSSSSGVHSVSLATTKTSLPADGVSTATITATVADGNNAAVPDGTVVQFSSNAGTISPAQSVTSGGKATATLTAGTTVGPVTVTATAGGKTSTITISLTQSTGTVGSIGLTASPTTIQVMGSGGAQTQSTITATCRDAQGNLATSGTVIFTSSLGSIVGTVPVGANGVATSTFSSNATGQATITASWSGAESSVTVNVTAGPPFAINVNSTPASVQCDGHSFATVTATVKDVAGNMVTDGTVVDFSIQSDVNGGGNGTITAQGRTSAGVATATLFSRTPGGVTSTP
ncbi:MAG TPA: invasin domain 3-containing protein, partial [Armatimonadota bacterium]